MIVLIIGVVLSMVTVGVPALAEEFEAIRNSMNNMTDLQWKQQVKRLEGQLISGNGWVVDVDKQFFGGYKVMVDMDPPEDVYSVQDIYIENVSKNIAYGLRKDQHVWFTGKIKSIHNILGVCSITIEYLKISK